MESTDNSKDRSNNWFATLNNPELDGETFLRTIFETGKIRYCCG